MYLILTQTQRDEIAGNTGKGAWLEPIALKNGKYALPDSVLSDEAHSLVMDKLTALPTAATVEWMPSAEEV